MSKIIKILSALLILISLSPAYSQSVNDILSAAEKAFYQDKRYSSAAFYYKKLLDDWNSLSKDKKLVYPYELAANNEISLNILNTAKDTGPSSENAKEIMFEYCRYQVAECNRSIHNYTEAEYWYRKSLENDSLKYPLSKLRLGEALISNSKYDEALSLLLEFQKEYNNKDEHFEYSELLTGKCRFAAEQASIQEHKYISSQLNGAINQGNANFGVTYHPEDSSTLLFTSAIPQDGLFQTDIYSSKINDNGATDDRMPVNIPISSSANEGMATFSSDGQMIIFTRQDDKGTFLYYSKKSNGKWSLPEKMDEKINTPGYLSKHPHLTPDGENLYFVSDKPGGQGETDIWMAKLNKNGDITQVRNAGKPINTTETEEAPFFHTKTNTLFFSSNGHYGMGGVDLFSSTPDKRKWSEPVNLGASINTGRDESYITFDARGENGYFASDKENCNECETGNCYSIYAIKKSIIKLELKCIVYDEETQKPIAFASIFLIHETGEIIDTISYLADKSGVKKTTLDKELEYTILAEKEGYFNSEVSFNTYDIKDSKVILKEIYLKPIPKGEIVLEGILYDLDKWELRDESKIILNGLVEILEKNSRIKIEIAAHTDSRGSDVYNQKLSQKRAESVVKYLISKGIHPDRLEAKGYGESQLLIKDAIEEDEHQKNRRTTFKVL